jgi:hypothetical protein
MLEAHGGSKSIAPSRSRRRITYPSFWASNLNHGPSASPRVLSGIAPCVEQIQLVGEIGNRIINALGIGDSSARVLRPYIDTLVVEPLRRHIDLTYRPRQASVAEAVRLHYRGTWDRQKVFDELGAQGYNNPLIQSLIDTNRKTFSVAQTRLLLDRNVWSQTECVDHLKEQGYDLERAGLALSFELLQRHEQSEARLAAKAIAAYTNRDIERSEFLGFMAAHVRNEQERSFLTDEAEWALSFNVKRLSLSEVRACVKAGILAMIDYRRALEQEGYPPDAVLSLELLLRHELDEKRRIEDLREEAEKERAAEQAARAAAAAKRRAEIEAERALRRRGPIGDLEQAVVRGIVTIARLEEVLSVEYDADTVQILVALVEQDRLAYLERQRLRDEAAQRGTARGIDVGQLERAVWERVISVGDYRTRLSQLGFAAGDADLLAATLQARLDARDAAEREREDARKRAAVKQIDLGRFERLVRAGARDVRSYDRLLEDLGFDDASRAAMRELLEIQIAEDSAARAEREAAAAKLRARGLSLEQFERAVLLGVKSLDNYDRFLLDQGFVADARIALLALLRDRLTEAEAARARRDATTEEGGASTLPLSTARRAARLGIITPDAYAERVAAAGYSAEDVAIELELLLVEIAETQAGARAARHCGRRRRPRASSRSGIWRAP